MESNDLSHSSHRAPSQASTIQTTFLLSSIIISFVGVSPVAFFDWFVNLS